jgi:UDP-N-acetylglucosamine/UDP-N-acetyl-alpha-D-glucosaminouronate 4-epimerase
VKVLVTGGAGFIGSHLVERLLQENYEVRVLDNFSTGRRENILDLGEVELVEGDLQSYERAHTAVRGCEIVFHQAALPSVPRSIQDPLTTNASNVIGTLNVLLSARDSGVRRVIFASSSSVYGANATLPKSEGLSLAPISPYAVSKVAGEGYCRSFWEVYGLETVALRYFNVFGPRQDPRSQYAAVVPNFITAFLTGVRPAVYGDGNQTRDFTYVGNVVDGTVRAMQADGAAGKTFNIACGEQVSVNRLLDELRKLTGADVEPRYVDPRRGEVTHSHADISLAGRELGYVPRIALDEGLKLTIAHRQKEQTSQPRRESVEIA